MQSLSFDQGLNIQTNTIEACTLPTTVNEAYGIATTTNDTTTLTNEAYVATSISTPLNQMTSAMH